MNNLFPIFVALLLVALNGFFVAAEFGLVKLRQTRIRLIVKTQGWRGRILGKVHANSMPIYLPASWALRSLRWAWAGLANPHLPAC